MNFDSAKNENDSIKQLRIAKKWRRKITAAEEESN
jgi:hypothetical protein